MRLRGWFPGVIRSVPQGMSKGQTKNSVKILTEFFLPSGRRHIWRFSQITRLGPGPGALALQRIFSG